MLEKSLAGSVVCLVLASPAVGLAAAEPVDWQMVNRLRDEGFHRSRVVETVCRIVRSQRWPGSSRTGHDRSSADPW